MAGYSRVALGVLFIALVRNLKDDFTQHRDFDGQIKFWADLVRAHHPDPTKDEFASAVCALEFLNNNERALIGEMHGKIAEVLTKLADSSQTGQFRWSNCDFAVFEDILQVADRMDLAGPPPGSTPQS